ncbi:hypothetical protein FCH28_37230 [Streptomyces piniterrae]|uniref:C2H2-type domain-containing protein n=1 Tax=Streptomyces piniterrae TaxID=2571125 RepID=A0A4U0MWD1_9ACTN|nr:hypothetical protein [Streptomyces piniterrae]TJZ41474.1 hypothetical protein FCH28_37230 [Streptomyces piniterrae]
MSEIAQTPSTATSGAHPIPPSEPAAREAYAFACMKCGHGWEQSYEIEHQVDATGSMHVVYYAEGERVPSPLTRPTCLNCGATVVRIMRSGQVSMVSNAIANMHQRQGGGPAKNHTKKNGEPVVGEAAGENTGSTAEDTGRHHWHLSDLLHPFQNHRR